jgi:golgin subfamily B member 1
MLGDAEASEPRASAPMPDSTSDELGRDLEREEKWDELIAALIEGAARTTSTFERIALYRRAAGIYETRLHDSEKAYITMQAALGDDYRNDDVADEVDRLARALGQIDALIPEYEALLPEVADVDQKIALCFQLARWQEARGLYDAAEARLLKAAQMDPGSMYAVRALADLYDRRQDPQRKAEHLARSASVVRRQADRAALALEAAELYHHKLMDLAEATVQYGKVLEIQPDSPPALEGLVQITWDDENWARALPLLEQLAGNGERPAADRSRTHQRAALAALRVGDEDRARAHARAVLGLAGDDGASTTFLRDWFDIAYSRKWWPDVRLLAEWLQKQTRDAPSDTEDAELKTRLGQALVDAGEIEAARVELEEAVSLDPTQRRAREVLADVLSRLGDAAAALDHKKVLVEAIGPADERFNMLVDMARVSRDELSSPQQALEAFEEARTLNPGERSIQHEMLELYSELKQWLPASEVLLTLAEDAVPPERARYLVAAANILHYELSDTEAATELYERALDDDPSDLKTFERLDKILTARRDFKEQARSYRRMIKRVGPASSEPDKQAVLLLLWRGLAEIYRTRLSDVAAAMAALEVCTQLDPSSLVEQEALAELYEASGPESFRQAVDRRTLLFEKSADAGAMVRQLKALRAIYAQAGQWDRVFCVCAALTVLQAADEEELGFYERGAAATMPVPRSALTEEIWQKVIYDAAEDRRLSLLFSCVAPLVALARAQDGRALGIKERFRLDPEGDPSGVGRLFLLGASVLNLPGPAVYLNRDFNGEVEILNLRDSAGATPSVMVGPSIVHNRVEKDVAFVVGRTLALMRPDHLVLSPHVVPNAAELPAIVHAAFKLCQPSAAIPNPPTFQPYLALFQKMLPPAALEPLTSLVPWLIESWRTLDFTAWRLGAERTADRAGLLLCGDLGAAVRVLHATRGVNAGSAVLDLVRWSVSEGHLGLRDLLGVSAASSV